MGATREAASIVHAQEIVLEVYAEATFWARDEQRRERDECERICQRIRRRAEADIQEVQRHYDQSIQDTQIRGQKYQQRLRDINQKFEAVRVAAAGGVA